MLLALGPVLVLVGCSPYGDPVRWEAEEVVVGVPAVEWPLGAPELGNVWVAALVRADAALAAAGNGHDFSSPELSALVGSEHLWRMATSARDEAGLELNPGHSSYRYAPGPTPMRVLKVEVDGDEGFVTACTLSMWTTSETEPMTIEDMQAWGLGRAMRYSLLRDASGVIRLIGEGWARGRCEMTGVRPGFFDPAPPFGEDVLAVDFVSPDGGVMPSSQGLMPDGTWVERD